MSPQKNVVSSLCRAGALLTFLPATLPASALAQESGGEAPLPDATAMVGFLIVFVAMIAGYILWIMHQHKKQQKQDPKEGGSH